MSRHLAEAQRSHSPFLFAPLSSEYSDRASTPRLKVWLVEDNHTDVFVIRGLLDTSGLRVDILPIEHGEEALAWIDDQNKPCPDLILLDLNMPRVSGLDVLKTLRESERFGEVPVIVITSSQSVFDRQETRRLGGNAFFTKPGNLTEYQKLTGVVREVLGIR